MPAVKEKVDDSLFEYTWEYTLKENRHKKIIEIPNFENLGRAINLFDRNFHSIAAGITSTIYGFIH